MNIRFFNTLSRTVEDFKPQKKGKVTIYNCGPTAYDTPHLGNYRTIVMYDILRRLFEYNGYKVDQAMNITDVDDKTIRRSRAENVSLKELTRKYEMLFLEGLDSLNISRPNHLIRATESISAMKKLIKALIDKGVAYKADDGVYMSIEKVKNYGLLAGMKSDNQLETADSKSKSEEQKSKSRIANDEYDKDDPRDFSLWKFKTTDDGDVSWKAAFGEGRPGWHIECSAMAMEEFGPTVDIHTGGMDLIFPHHTNEIAQSESATGKQFARFWIHGAFMNFNDEKMAKSKGNVVKLEDLPGESISPIGFRYWLLTAHYRSPVNFTFEAVRGAQNALIRLMAAVSGYPDGGEPNKAYMERFQAHIDNDMDMPGAVALAWEILKDATVSRADKRATLIDFDRVFGLGLANVPKMQDEKIPDEIQVLAEAREEARKGKDWKKSDALRVEIEKRGYEVSDTNKGIKIKKQRAKSKEA